MFSCFYDGIEPYEELIEHHEALIELYKGFIEHYEAFIEYHETFIEQPIKPLDPVIHRKRLYAAVSKLG
jgi:hypothetical protein